jgi:hypothetical protein
MLKVWLTLRSEVIAEIDEKVMSIDYNLVVLAETLNIFYDLHPIICASLTEGWWRVEAGCQSF